MSRSIHTSRPKFRKAFRFQYSSGDERIRVLGKIIDEVGLKRAMKANARVRKQCRKAGIEPADIYAENRAAASRKSLPTKAAQKKAGRHIQNGYG